MVYRLGANVPESYRVQYIAAAKLLDWAKARKKGISVQEYVTREMLKLLGQEGDLTLVKAGQTFYPFQFMTHTPISFPVKEPGGIFWLELNDSEADMAYALASHVSADPSSPEAAAVKAYMAATVMLAAWVTCTWKMPVAPMVKKPLKVRQRMTKAR